MNNTNPIGASDLLQNFKAVPDIRSRLAVVGLVLICLVVPIASSSVFGMGTSFCLNHPVLLGSWAYWLTLLAIASLAAPAFAQTRPLTRVLDALVGVGAVLAALDIGITFVRAFSELAMASGASRALSGQRFDSANVVSIDPGFGLAFFIVLVGFAAVRGIKAIKFKPTAALPPERSLPLSLGGSLKMGC